jgi:hypothetical protein
MELIADSRHTNKHSKNGKHNTKRRRKGSVNLAFLVVEFTLNYSSIMTFEVTDTKDSGWVSDVSTSQLPHALVNQSASDSYCESTQLL